MLSPWLGDVWGYIWDTSWRWILREPGTGAGTGGRGRSLTLHIATAGALRVGEQSVTGREGLILKYSFANKKP